MDLQTPAKYSKPKKTSMSNEAGIYSAPLTLGLLDDLQDSKEDHSKEEKAKIEVLELSLIHI